MLLNLYRNDDINFIESEMSYFGTIPPFDGFKFLGWTKDDTTDEEGPIGYESDIGEFFIPVFIKNFCIDIISSEEEREQKAIDSGKNCVILIYGKTDSYVMRFTSKELKYIDLSFFNDEDTFKSFYMGE